MNSNVMAHFRYKKYKLAFGAGEDVNRAVVTGILFDNISRIVELLVQPPEGEARRGRLNLSRIYGDGGDFILQGTGVISKQEHRFALSQVLEIVDVETGEIVDVAEFRAELAAHPKT